MSNVKDVRDTGPGVPIELGGETRYLRFDLNAFAELEELYGSIEDAMDALEKGSIKAIRAIIWAGLVHQHMDDLGRPTLPVSQVGSWIELKDIPTLSGTLGKAFAEAMPSQEEMKAAGDPLAPKVN